MARVLRQAGELSRMKADFVVRSRHETASGTAEITVRSHSVWICAALAAIALVPQDSLIDRNGSCQYNGVMKIKRGNFKTSVRWGREVI